MTPTDKILDRFEQIAAIPRQTKHEEQIARWLQDWAASHKYPTRKDEAGNLTEPTECRVPGRGETFKLPPERSG